MTAQTVDGDRLRTVVGAFPTGVTAVAALVDGTPVGMAASSFTSVSLDPPLVSVCVARSSTTWPTLRAAEWVGLSVLSAEQGHIGRQLAARDVDRFAGLQWRDTPRGSIVLDGASAWLECRIVDEHAAGDHDIVVLQVTDLDADHDRHPLVFHASRFRRLER